MPALRWHPVLAIQSASFPAELKFAGFDGLVIQGKADAPVYLWLHDGEAGMDASHLWERLPPKWRRF